ncbi:MAG: hypothetical protein ACKVOR_10680 [Flavobacteriales bacterium]
MKKVALFLTLAVACVSGAFAQKQTGGEKNIEVQFSPLGGNPISMSGIRLRMFNSESSAIRIGLFIGGNSSETISQEADNDNDLLELIDTDKEFGFSIRLGYEMHFAGTDRLSPYWGGEVSFGSTSTTMESMTQYDDDGDPKAYTMTEKGGTSSFGINAVAGCDFYFSDAIYMGAEIAFGFGRTKDKENEVTFVDAPDGFDDATSIEGNTTSSAWGPGVQGTLRLGWLFN